MNIWIETNKRELEFLLEEKENRITLTFSDEQRLNTRIRKLELEIQRLEKMK